MRFLIHPLEILDGWPEVFAACISGPEARICPTRIEIDGNVLSCYRDGTESGKLQVVWPVEGFGRPVVTTTSLMERDEPYLLAVELVRGKIAQNCDQASAWEIAGMVLPDEFARLQKQSFQLFSQAVSIQDDPEKSSDLARDALTQSCKAAEALVKSYTDQRLAVRRQRFPQLPASLGCNVGQGIPDDSWNEKFCQAFNAAAVPVEWKNIESVEGDAIWDVNDEQVEWCHKHRLLMYGGPLLDFSPNGLPEWLWQWEKDLPNVQSFVNNFVETAISRYVGRIRHWEIAARPNTGGALAWNEENRLTLVANMLEVARHVDEETQLTIRVDLPWGDYQAREQHQLSPMQFVDALVRSGTGLSGVNL